MARTITPGYDFGTRETPTRDTMRRAALGLKMSGLGVADVGVGLVGIKSGDTSNVTDSIQVGETVGTIWVSPLGDVWVQEQAGAVKLSSIHYGWETKRLATRLNSVLPIENAPGLVVQPEATFSTWEWLDRFEGGQTRFTGTQVLEVSNDGSYANNRAGAHFGCIQETIVSQSTYVRVGFRGIHLYRDEDAADSTTWSDLFEFQNTMRLKTPDDLAANPLMATYNLGSGADLPAWKFYGWAGHPAVSSSKVSNTGLDATWKRDFMMWCFGGIMYANLQAGT